MVFGEIRRAPPTGCMRGWVPALLARAVAQLVDLVTYITGECDRPLFAIGVWPVPFRYEAGQSPFW